MIMSSDNQFTALGPAVIGFQTHGTNITVGADITGNQIGVQGSGPIGVSGIGSRATTTNPSIGVSGSCDDGIGVHGFSKINSGVDGQSISGAGVDGRSKTGIGVDGNSESNTGGFGQSTSGIGVHGNSESNTGVFGQSPSKIGVHGLSESNTGAFGQSTSGFAVHGFSESNTGVFGQSTSGIAVHGHSESGLAGRFDGDVQVTGNLSATGTKPFVQAHPTDPDKEIVYIALEGGEAGTYMRGSGQLESGKAVLSLPEHFGLVTASEGLTVQLTPRGQWLQLYVVELDTAQLVVREAQGKSGTFDYLIQGVRRGFEKHEVIRTKR